MLNINSNQECIFATHLPNSKPDHDYHLVKIHEHQPDGSFIPR